jgi:spore coat protein H
MKKMGDNLNLPIYQLYIHPADLNDLKNDIWNDEPVPAVLKINKKRYEIDINYRGSFIRKLKKKSYHVSFYKPSLFRGVKEIHLNAEYNDLSLIRNKLSLDFFSDIGTLSPKSKHVTINLNGKNEGVYLELESVDEKFLEKRNLPKGPIYYAIDGDANFSLMSDLDKEVKRSLDLGYERKCGTDLDDLYLNELIIKINTMTKLEFESEIINYINVEKYLLWLAGVIFTQNYDGFVHNYALYRNSDTCQFEVIPWDYDATWGRDVRGEIMEEDYVRIEGFNTLTARILDVKAFRAQYKKILTRILNEQFTLEYMKPKVEKLYKLLRPNIMSDSYIKGRIEKFDQEPGVIFKYIRSRSNYIKNNLYKLD